MSKRKQMQPLGSDSEESDSGEQFDVMEFSALQHGNDERVQGLKRLQEKRGGVNNTVCWNLFL